MEILAVPSVSRFIS